MKIKEELKARGERPSNADPTGKSNFHIRRPHFHITIPRRTWAFIGMVAVICVIGVAMDGAGFALFAAI